MTKLTKYLRRAVAGIALVAAGLALTPTITFADAGDGVATVAESGKSLVMSEPSWSLAIGVVLPFIIATITRATSSSRVKAIVGAVAALVAAIVARRVQLPNGEWSLSLTSAFDAAVLWLMSTSAYQRLYRPVFGDDFNAKFLPKIGI